VGETEGEEEGETEGEEEGETEGEEEGETEGDVGEVVGLKVGEGEGETVGLEVGPAFPIDIDAEVPVTERVVLCPADMVPSVTPSDTTMRYSCTPKYPARKSSAMKPSSSVGTSENSRYQVPEGRQYEWSP
jgi:hypothetical protein